MNKFYEATDRELYTKLSAFFPVVTPDPTFLVNAFNASEDYLQQNVYPNTVADWEKESDKWLADNAGLLVYRNDTNTRLVYRLFDEKLYAFALLRWS